MLAAVNRVKSPLREIPSFFDYCSTTKMCSQIPVIVKNVSNL